MKKLIKSLLPDSILNIIRLFKMKCRILTTKAKILLSLPLQKKPDKIKFEINLAEHCNLNCRSCSNFSNIAEPELVSIESFTSDMKRMGELFGHVCERIYLIGGEPLLHPEICAMMKIARENFTEGNIFVYTNGILLGKQEDKFWETCRDNNIDILISAYPIKLDMESIRSSAEKFGVSVKWALNQKENERNIFTVEAINLAGTGNVKLNFAMCSRACGCITLKHGRLFTCTFAAHVEHFNKRFGQNVNITEADYIDIYKTDDPDEILRRLSEPIPACRYCDKLKLPKTITWGHTKQEMSEWL